MPAITRVSDRPYRWKITEAPLAKVANVEKMLPRNFITRDGFGITPRARALSRRRCSRARIRRRSATACRDYVRLKNVAVAKKLATTFKV